MKHFPLLSISGLAVLAVSQDIPTETQTSEETARIAFHWAIDGNPEIYVMNADGSNRTRLTNNPAADVFPSWSPDGKKIAFTSLRDGSLPGAGRINHEIYVMNADGSDQTRLTNNPAQDQLTSNLSPKGFTSWSPDRTKIIFTSRRDNPGIYVMDADGSNQKNLTENPAFDAFPSWSPDGQRIVFPSDRDGNTEIYVMDADGRNQTRLTNNPADDGWPAWSPDGTRFTFQSGRDGNPEIYVMEADGRNQSRLTDNPGFDASPSWSPDGMQIMFLSARDGDLGVYVMNADGSNQTKLGSGDGPSWSPARN